MQSLTRTDQAKAAEGSGVWLLIHIVMIFYFSEVGGRICVAMCLLWALYKYIHVTEEFFSSCGDDQAGCFWTKRWWMKFQSGRERLFVDGSGFLIFNERVMKNGRLAKRTTHWLVGCPTHQRTGRPVGQLLIIGGIGYKSPVIRFKICTTFQKATKLRHLLSSQTHLRGYHRQISGEILTPVRLGHGMRRKSALIMSVRIENPRGARFPPPPP